MNRKASFYRNGQRIMRESKEEGKKEKISFMYSKRRGCKIFAKYGDVKTYANRKQANRNAKKLRELGYNVHISPDWPFVIILEE